MKTILTGSIAGGFTISAVVPDDQADDIVIRLLADGRLAEAIDIKSPKSLSKRAKEDAEGTHFVVYGKSLGTGFNMFGPFAESEYAEKFAEDNRGDDDEWEIFSFSSEHTPQDHYTEILQHRIKFWMRGEDAPNELDDCSVEHIESC